MKRLFSLLLAAILLLGCPAPAASADKDAQSFSDSIRAQAFAVAMACHEGDFSDGVTPADPDFLWEATGWYAAWLYRTEHVDLMEEAQIRDFQSSFGVRDGGQMSVEWLENVHGIRFLRRSDGGVSYDFAGHKARMDELLGVTLEFLLDAKAPPEAVVTLREHYAVNSVFDLLKESGLLPELAAVPERDLGEVYGIDASKLKQWVFAMSSNYANDAGEVAIFEANDQEYVSELAQKLQNHLDRIKAVSKDYTPQQYAKVEPAEVKTVGSFVYMVVGEDYDALMKIMKDNIG